ncbi:hypothetical protein HK100_004444 [Physocladia obscura]|uniref:C3H1-type domain-containing protein n=1 Tax=Physocladia obscura TaxID=109957 RepID=A0AAD5X8R4_9FUNG|nr:hypothetical protein HK100_004444 [Physocladia obscura]
MDFRYPGSSSAIQSHPQTQSLDRPAARAGNGYQQHSYAQQSLSQTQNLLYALSESYSPSASPSPYGISTNPNPTNSNSSNSVSSAADDALVGAFAGMGLGSGSVPFQTRSLGRTARVQQFNITGNGNSGIGISLSHQQLLRSQVSLSDANLRGAAGIHRQMLMNQQSVNAGGVGGSVLPDKKSNLYKTEYCRSMEETGECRYGAKCQFAHSVQELRFVDRHPKYKTQVCKTFFETGDCPYGRRCCFIHSTASGESDEYQSKNPPPSSSRSRSFSEASPPATPGSNVSTPYAKLSQQQQVIQFSLQQNVRQNPTPSQSHYDDDPVSVIPKNQNQFSRNNFPMSLPNNGSSVSPIPSDIFQENSSRTSSPASSSYPKASTPISGLSGQLPSRRRVSDVNTNSGAGLEAFQQQRFRSRQPSFQDHLSDEINLPLRSASQDEHTIMLRHQQRPSLSVREVNSNGRDTPNRLGAPSKPVDNHYNVVYQQHQQQQQQQHQQQQHTANFSSSVDSVSSLSSHPDSSILATSAKSNGDSLFFEPRHSSFDEHSTQVLSPLNSFADRTVAPTSYIQRRTRSVTQPVTQSEEFGEFLFLQKQQSHSNQGGYFNYQSFENRFQANNTTGNSNGNHLFQFDGDDISRPFSAQPRFNQTASGDIDSFSGATSFSARNNQQSASTGSYGASHWSEN